MALCLAYGSGSCSASLPEPETTPHPSNAFARVPYPPPAAVVEVVPESPRPEAVWLDGSWRWQSGRWVWDRGGWMAAVEGTVLSRWQLRYLDDGTVVFAPDVWRDAEGRPVDPPRVLAPANPPLREATPEEIVTP